MTSYQELLNKYSSRNIPYNELITTVEWYDIRKRIIQRDGNKCKDCGTPGTTVFIPTGRYITKDIIPDENGLPVEIEVHGQHSIPDNSFGLDVHHTYRIKNKLTLEYYLPWDYPDDSLKTLCKSCHRKFHEKNTVPTYLR